MASNSELSKRVTTGVIGGLALFALIIWGGWVGIFVLTSVLCLGMMYEYAIIIYQQSDRQEKRNTLLCSGSIAALSTVVAPRAEFEVLIFSFLAYFAYFLFTAKRHSAAGDLQKHFQELSLTIFGLIYLLFVPFFLPRIHQSTYGVAWTVTFLFIVFAGDTGAYFAGMKWGKTKLYPAISPKKTREGALGGLAAGYLLTLLAKLTFFREMPWIFVVIAPALVGTVAQVGDFCESFVKRAYDKKDSGSILPGHGGFLDRFDGVVFSLPVMYACVRLFG